MAEDFYSVGIDVGTTTTQVVFSHLFLEKTGGFATIPNVRIAKKDVVFKSKIHFTPLISHDIVDAARLKDIVAAEYRNSTIDARNVTTGAVIITGESARKENARKVAHQLAEFAGDFVVCTAGPDYEAVLAGWGAGAGDVSKKLTGKVINFDIGGGTTNAAVFENGHVCDAFAADIGGRLVKVDSVGKITYVSEKIEPLIEHMGLTGIQVGCSADAAELCCLTDRMAEMFIEFIGEKSLTDDARALFIGHRTAGLTIDHVMFSGGVAEYVYDNDNAENKCGLYPYGDIGPLLGSSIRKILPRITAHMLIPNEKIRATVVGAGSYSTGISGSTVAFEDPILPIKNLPVIRVPYQRGAPKELAAKIAAQLKIYSGEQVAISVAGLQKCGYADVKQLAGSILEGLAGSDNPVIVLTEYDCAKALGLLLRASLVGSRPVICLDRIHAENGDYVDIGKPIGGVVPVIVKTLIFNS